ncbi:MAG: carbohydrate ABC transporter permease, partial [Anaerolineales bacterium]
DGGIPMRIDAQALLGWLVRHAAPILIAGLFCLPLVWMVSASLRQPGLPPPRTVEWIPNPLAWGNYQRIFEMLPLGRYLLNSVIVGGLAVPLTLVTASWAGFAMAQLGARARLRLTALSIGLLMIPATALWLTRYVWFSRLGLVNNYAALLAPALMGSSPLFVLLFYWAFRRLPVELFESAWLDGAHALTIWARIALPLTHRTSVVVGVFTFALYWSDFITPLLYLKSPSLYTLPVGLQQLQQLDPTNWPLLMAASVVITAPVVLLFWGVQHYFLSERWR